jgi:hypothetical protein
MYPLHPESNLCRILAGKLRGAVLVDSEPEFPLLSFNFGPSISVFWPEIAETSFNLFSLLQIFFIFAQNLPESISS